MTTRSALGLGALAAFVATVFGANWLLTTYGVISIGFGLAAPAGVLAAGLAFGLRDVVHETLGRWWVFVGIAVGGAASAFLSPEFALASAAAFSLSEVADFAVYAPLRERRWWAAVVASNMVGAVVDSLLFLWLAGFPLDLWVGQVVGKAYMIAPMLPLVWVVRRRLRP